MAAFAGRIIGMTFAAAGFIVATWWFVDGAPGLPNLEGMYDAASVNGGLTLELRFAGRASDSARLSTLLADKGYSADAAPCEFVVKDTVCFRLQQHLTGQEADATGARFKGDFGGKGGLWTSVYDMEAVYIERDFFDGRYSLAHGYLFTLTQGEAIGTRAFLSVIAVSVAAAALLAFLLLYRDTQTEALRWLGLGLSGWSASVAYLWLYSVVPTFAAWQASALPLGISLDVLAFSLLSFSSYAYIQFWKGFPQPVTDDALDSFLEALGRNQLAMVDRTRRRWSRFFKRDVADVRDGASALPVEVGTRPPGSRRARAARVLSGLLILGMAVTWAVAFRFILNAWVALAGLCSLVGFVLVVYWPGLTCLRIFRYHRSVGSAEDCRKIEWIWASIWMGFIAVVLPLVLLAFMMVGRYLFPGLEDGVHIATTLFFFGLSSGPLFVMVALAISILYRGTIDPRMALRGVTLFTLLGLVLTLIFVFVERTVAVHLVRLWGLPSQTGLVTAGALVAATFQPVRRYSEKQVTRFVERVLPASVLASGKRDTLAVAVVDISAYTALSAEDEQAALLASTLVQKEARRYAGLKGGRVVKSTGDGVIMCFATAPKAAEAVLELHRSIDKAGPAMNIPALRLHSGLHWGEVTAMHDGDIYGMSVNLTARIADWAKAGEIGVSQAFHDALALPPAGIEAAGPQRFKNVPQPVVCYRLVVV